MGGTPVGPTAADVARWMADELAERGILEQAWAAEKIRELFGESFIYTNENGNWAIARPVLASFRKLTAETAVWERSSFMWRNRTSYDEAGRRQAD